METGARGRASGRVCVLYTGGTIGTRALEAELHPHEPAMLSLEEVETTLQDACDVEFAFEALNSTAGRAFTPMVSSKVKPHHWASIAESIYREYDNYDGFVVLHGTDTMAWTASALSFMFGNLAKPIVLTGAQRPISATPSDAVSNVEAAVVLAGQGHDTIPVVPEVVLCFGDRVLRGNRSTKISSSSMQGFDTPNLPHLGRVGRRIDINSDALLHLPSADQPCYVRTDLERRVADIVLYPGMAAKSLDRALKGVRGAVLRTFGGGSAPGAGGVRRVLEKAAASGTVLVNVTQTDEGLVEAGMLSGSRALTDLGVLSGLDLTAEAAFTKLMVLLGSEPTDVAREQMQVDRRGEQSVDLIELRSGVDGSARTGPARVVLTPSLHARVRPDRLRAAVLRLRGLSLSDGQMTSCEVRVYLNHWRADASTGDEVGRADTSAPVIALAGALDGGTKDVALDVTELARRMLSPGLPVTLTLVPLGEVAVKVEAVVTLFTDSGQATDH